MMDVGREASISGILSTRRAVVIPGKQWIIASTKWTCRTIESPIIAVVGGFFGAGTALGTTGGPSDGVVLNFVDFVGWESDLDGGRGEEGTSNLRWTAFFNRLWRSSSDQRLAQPYRGGEESHHTLGGSPGPWLRG